MAPRNSLNAVGNKTLTVACAGCGETTTTDVDSNIRERDTWGVVGLRDGEKAIFPVCAKCYAEGWRPEGHMG